MSQKNIVSLTEESLGAAAESLARAFYNDPLQSYVFPDENERATRSPAHFAAALRYGMLFGEVLTTEGKPLGAAVWLPPETWEAANRFFSALGAIEPYHHRDVPPAHWYLMVIGVSPEACGQGLGRALIEPIMNRADASGLPCYLETAQPNNVAFYEYLGFKNIVETVEPQSGLRLWTFRRDPPALAPSAV
jgi:ribosomal protein S18 acetylase RimI-like enzyme